MKRFASIATAYLAGAIVGSYGLIVVFHFLVKDLGPFLMDLLGSPTTALVGIVFGAPVAVVVIAVTEYCKWDSPKLMIGVGIALGIVLTLLFIEEPVLSVPMLKATSAAVIGVTMGTFTYWFVAWRIFPPAYLSCPEVQENQ